MNRVLNLRYASSLTNLCEVNSSFDTGVLRIAYPGQNKNGSYISKDSFEDAIKTIYNCPIVCNYDRETDTLGGHDMEVVRDSEGNLSLVNMTTPVGCVPESSNVFWDVVDEDDGTVHEYLCAEVLLWKRQEAYRKIKQDGVVEHSMEITVQDGATEDDGLYHINRFEFTAFALIGVTPCFESSSLQVFSEENFKQQFAQMMSEIKQNFTQVNTLSKVDDRNSTEGGEQKLSKEEINSKGIDPESLNLSTDGFNSEEPEQQDQAEPVAPDNSAEDKTDFMLQSAIESGLCAAFESDLVQNEWGESPRYIYADMDVDAGEVYAWDTTNWLLYGFSYSLNGDNVEINYDSKTRKKYVIADYDEGEQPSPFNDTFAAAKQYIETASEWQQKFESASQSMEAMTAELTELRQFKSDAESAVEEGKREEIFAQFADLDGVEAFDALKADSAQYDVDTLEEKCFAIRGRQAKVATFSLEPKAPKLKVQKENKQTTPYGGIFEKYGFSENN